MKYVCLKKVREGEIKYFIVNPNFLLQIWILQENIHRFYRIIYEFSFADDVATEEI